MATERIDIVVSERGARVVKRSIEEIGQSAERSRNGIDMLNRAIGRDAVGALKQMERGSAGLSAKMVAQEKAVNGAAMAHKHLARATRQAAFQQRMLMFQLNDIGVSLASGMNPLMVMVQQGAQIQQIYAGEGGVNKALRDTGRMLGGVITRFPLMTAAIAGGSAAIAGMTYEIRKAGHASVTFVDVLRATFDELTDRIYGVLQPAIKAIAPWFAEAWRLVVDTTKTVGNEVINTFTAIYEIIKTQWDELPVHIEREFIRMLNRVIGQANKVLTWMTQHFPARFKPGRFDPFDVPLSPPGEAPHEIALRHKGQDPLGDFFGDVTRNAAGIAQGRLDKESGFTDRVTDARQMLEIMQMETAILREQMAGRHEIAAQMQRELELRNLIGEEVIAREPQLAESIRTQIKLQDDLNEQIVRQKRFFRELQQTISQVFDQLVDGLMRGKVEWENLAQSIIRWLIRIALQRAFSAIFGGTNLGSLLGFGGGLPGFQNGGSFTVGPQTSVGTLSGVDNRLIAFRARDNERVTITRPGQRTGGPGGGSQVINTFTTNIDAPGADAGTVERLQAILDIRDRQLEERIPNLVALQTRQNPNKFGMSR